MEYAMFYILYNSSISNVCKNLSELVTMKKQTRISYAWSILFEF